MSETSSTPGTLVTTTPGPAVTRDTGVVTADGDTPRSVAAADPSLLFVTRDTLAAVVTPAVVVTATASSLVNLQSSPHSGSLSAPSSASAVVTSAPPSVLSLSPMRMLVVVVVVVSLSPSSSPPTSSRTFWMTVSKLASPVPPSLARPGAAVAVVINPEIRKLLLARVTFNISIRVSEYRGLVTDEACPQSRPGTGQWVAALSTVSGSDATPTADFQLSNQLLCSTAF